VIDPESHQAADIARDEAQDRQNSGRADECNSCGPDAFLALNLAWRSDGNTIVLRPN
jgi:hypothetical protein